MAKGFELVAELRDAAGQGASRRLRRAGYVPAILYGGGEKPLALSLDHNELLRNIEQEAFLSSVLMLKMNGGEQPAIVKDVHVHPAKRRVLHLDLQRIVADEEIRMTVPLHFLNEETAVGVKTGGGTVAHLMSEIEVTCLPKDLPEYLELDIAELQLDETLNLSDIKLPPGVTIPELTPEQDRAVVSIHIIKVVEEPEEGEEEVPEGEVPVGDEGEAEKPEDGEEESSGD